MIIRSLLNTDLYEFTMMQVALHHFPDAHVEHRFKCRNAGVDLVPFIKEIRAKVRQLCTLRFTDAELDYLHGIRFIKSDFVDFLGLSYLNERYINLHQAPSNDRQIEIVIAGPWLHTIMFEVPVLAVVSGVFFGHTQTHPQREEDRRRLTDKLASLKRPGLENYRIADYGARRRFSHTWHEHVLLEAHTQLSIQYAGTNNVYFAMRHGMTSLGTTAHEYLQACRALGPRLHDSQTLALETWAKEYRGDLDITLSGTYGFDAFLRDSDMFFCKLPDGVRHDSGDPSEWDECIFKHYDDMRAESKSKTLILSDNLDMSEVIDLYEHFHSRCKLTFGVGTNLTNDLGCTSLQIVIKMVCCNGRPVAKLSDAPEETMYDDPAYLTYLKRVFGVQ